MDHGISNRIPVVLLLLCSLAFFGCSENKGRAVILISLDTLRQDHLGCYGYGREVSPALDLFAKEDAVLFEAAYCQAPYTLPSHMSIMTGLYPETHNILVPFVAKAPDLHKEGYTIKELGGRLFAVRGEEGSQTMALMGECTTIRLADEVQTLAEVFHENGYATTAFTDGVLMDAKYGFDQGFDEYRDEYSKEPEENGFRRSGPAMHQWIRENAERDFFLFLHTYDTHGPYPCPESYRSRFRGEPPARERPPVSLVHSNLLNFHANLELHQYSNIQDLIDRYDGCIAFVDDELKKLFTLLEELGLWEDALVVVTSDHGEAFMENGLLIGHGMSATNEVALIPLLIKFPGSAHAGNRVSRLVESVDIMPTMLSALDLPVPPGVQGQDLLAGVARGQWKKDHAFGIIPISGNNHYLVRNGIKFIEEVIDPDGWAMKMCMKPLSPPGAPEPDTPYFYANKELSLYYDFDQDLLGISELFWQGDRVYDLSDGQYEWKAPVLTDPKVRESLKKAAHELADLHAKQGLRYKAESASGSALDEEDIRRLKELGYGGIVDTASNPERGQTSSRITPSTSLTDRRLLNEGDALLWKLARMLDGTGDSIDVAEMEEEYKHCCTCFNRFLEQHADKAHWVEWRFNYLDSLVADVREQQIQKH